MKKNKKRVLSEAENVSVCVSFIPSMTRNRLIAVAHRIVNGLLYGEEHRALINSERYAYDICYNCTFFRNSVCTNNINGDLSRHTFEEYGYLLLSDESDCPGYNPINK